MVVGPPEEHAERHRTPFLDGLPHADPTADHRVGDTGAVVDAADRETVDLLSRWNGGDEDALAELLTRNMDWIRGHVRRRLGQALRRKAETEDFVQDAVLEMLRYGPRFVVQRRAQFRALLARIAENVLRGKHDWFHRERRAMSKEVRAGSDSVLPLDPAASQTTPSEAVVRGENASWIRLALELLPPRDREVILMREWQEMAFAEIAGALGVAEDAARMRFQRALVRLARTAKRLRDGEIDGLLAEAPD